MGASSCRTSRQGGTKRVHGLPERLQPIKEQGEHVPYLIIKRRRRRRSLSRSRPRAAAGHALRGPRRRSPRVGPRHNGGHDEMRPRRRAGPGRLGRGGYPGGRRRRSGTRRCRNRPRAGLDRRPLGGTAILVGPRGRARGSRHRLWPRWRVRHEVIFIVRAEVQKVVPIPLDPFALVFGTHVLVRRIGATEPAEPVFFTNLTLHAPVGTGLGKSRAVPVHLEPMSSSGRTWLRNQSRAEEEGRGATPTHTDTTRHP